MKNNSGVGNEEAPGAAVPQPLLVVEKSLGSSLSPVLLQPLHGLIMSKMCLKSILLDLQFVFFVFFSRGPHTKQKKNGPKTTTQSSWMHSRAIPVADPEGDPGVHRNPPFGYT